MEFANPQRSRARTLVSTAGHAIEFPPADKQTGEMVYVHVPPHLTNEAISMGLEPKEALPDEPEPEGPVEPTDPDTRQSALFETFELLIATNAREDFSGNGYPKAEAISKLLGWAPKKPELAATWQAYQTRDLKA